METFSLKSGDCEARFSLQSGLRLVSFKKGGVEVVEHEGAVIGPHLGKKDHASWSVEEIQGKFVAKEGKRCVALSLDDALHLELSAVAESDALVGFLIPFKGRGLFTVQAQTAYLTASGKELWPVDWQVSSDGTYRVPQEAQFEAGIHPYPNPLEGVCRYKTSDYTVELSLRCRCEESSFYISHPTGNEAVKIGVLSSYDPWHPNLTASTVQFSLKIL
ncbi:MAG: hypothetical protein KDK48_04620 [Chlamydiia bacterium]|nr:hypothetical protein [Chlamydiia bacterium]